MSIGTVGIKNKCDFQVSNMQYKVVVKNLPNLPNPEERKAKSRQLTRILLPELPTGISQVSRKEYPAILTVSCTTMKDCQGIQEAQKNRKEARDPWFQTSVLSDFREVLYH